MNREPSAMRAHWRAGRFRSQLRPVASSFSAQDPEAPQAPSPSLRAGLCAMQQEPHKEHTPARVKAKQG